MLQLIKLHQMNLQYCYIHHKVVSPFKQTILLENESAHTYNVISQKNHVLVFITEIKVFSQRFMIIKEIRSDNCYDVFIYIFFPYCIELWPIKN